MSAGNTPAGVSASFTNPLTNVNTVQEIATGSSGVTCLRKADGNVWCFGVNDKGAVGPGIPIGMFAFSLVKVPLPAPATGIAVGADFSCALRGSTGQIFCWGDNSLGQLGNGMTSMTPTSTPVEALRQVGTNFTSRIYAGDHHVCLILAPFGNSVMCWGDNTFGQRGNGNKMFDPMANFVGDASGSMALALSATHSCALRADGTVRCWGGSPASPCPSPG